MRKFLVLAFVFVLSACQTESRFSSYKKVALITPDGDTIKTVLAITPQEQEQGLSGVKSNEFEDDEGMLFFYLVEDEKYFWMPDTYFNLDIFYLDKDFKVLDMIRNLPHYIGRANPDLIPRARPVWGRHALEMRNGSPISKKLKIGDKLKWKGDPYPSEIEDSARRKND